MSTFLATLHRSGPDYRPEDAVEEQAGWPDHAAFMDDLVDRGVVLLGGPLDDEHRVVLVLEAASEEQVCAILGSDPWSASHLVLVSVERWTIRLGRGAPG